MFTEESIVVREICNGVMTVSAVFLVAVLLAYVLRWSKRMVYRRWYNDIAIQGSIAVMIMMLGHAIRSGGSWLQFFYLDIGANVFALVNTIEFFVAATCLIVLGKMLIIWFFSDEQHRVKLVLAALVTCITIPTVVAVIAQMF